MITGFNTDIEHEGVTYHVQTEDKGLKSPLILSLVYVGGTILASKRTPYDDLIAAGFDEHELAERLGRQHRLICAAILAGRIEDLKRQTERDSTFRAKPSEEEQESEERESVFEDPDLIKTGSFDDWMPPSSFTAPLVMPEEPVAFEGDDESFQYQTDHLDYSRVVDYNSSPGDAEDLQISLLEETRFVAGEFVKIEIHVGGGVEGRESVADVPVIMKILGSSFRPSIFTEKTGTDGMATFYAMLPYFTSGRAAILINATTGGHKAELRRVIHQA